MIIVKTWITALDLDFSKKEYNFEGRLSS